MRRGYLVPRDLIFVLPAASILGAGLAAMQPGSFWIGWIGFWSLLTLGMLGMAASFRSAGGARVLAWMTVLSLGLRLAVGVALYVALPLNGYKEPDDQAGFVFTDAHRRDDQAWQLASSGKPLWKGFDRRYYTDQYGGLLVLSAVSYKIFSPDAHRPLLILCLAALTAAIGVPFAVRATRLLWSESLALIAGWLFVTYPESVLTGGAQMREPFLLTFMAIAFWGFAQWQREGSLKSLWWLSLAIGGMLLISPAMALALLILLGGWLWLRRDRRFPWALTAGIGVALLASVIALTWSLSRRSDFGGGSSPALILNWFRSSVNWVIYQLEQGSGQVQNLFSKLNPLMQFLFVVGYGIAQPLLPPAFFEPTTLTWHIIAVLRALGWTVLLPLLVYAPVAAGRAEPGAERRTWLWIVGFCWAWILICAVRAGGDQWDNPRYRLIFFGFESLAAGYAWLSWRARRDAWLPRVVVAEIVCLGFFTQWYVARYDLIGIHFPILFVLILSMTSVAVILVGGWLWDRTRTKAGPP